MEQILDLPSTAQKPLNYAGFWIRFAAYIIDYFVVSIASYILMAIFGISMFMNPNDLNVSLMVSMYGLMLIAWVAYYVAMESSALQGTLGKMAVGIKVGNEKGERISVANAVGRFFSKLLSGMILMIGYMMAGWDPKKQALHDKIANTYVFFK